MKRLLMWFVGALVLAFFGAGNASVVGIDYGTDWFKASLIKPVIYILFQVALDSANPVQLSKACQLSPRDRGNLNTFWTNRAPSLRRF